MVDDELVVNSEIRILRIHPTEALLTLAALSLDGKLWRK